MVSVADILNARILIVDDLQANVLLLERSLRGAGYACVATTMDPFEVCELHRKNRYDLILLDLEMPGMDGFQVMECLKEIEADGFLSVLVVTAHPGHKLRALQAGARDFVSQPIDLDEVLTRAKNMIEVRLLYTKIQQRRVSLDKTNKELEWFTHSVSHDLRSPLRLTGKIAHLLLQEYGPQLPAGAVEKIHMIVDSTQEMGKLIEDFLKFSQLNSKPIRRRRVDMRRLIGEALAELRDEQKGREIEVVIDNMSPCLGDTRLLKHVFLNLLANALKFTRLCESAKIHVGVTQSDGEAVYFVRDNGVGFDMSDSESIFLAFHRLHQTCQFEGSGVGLALVKRIIERHGGRIWAEGQTDSGATFYFTLGEISAVWPSLPSEPMPRSR